MSLYGVLWWDNLYDQTSWTLPSSWERGVHYHGRVINTRPKNHHTSAGVTNFAELLARVDEAEDNGEVVKIRNIGATQYPSWYLTAVGSQLDDYEPGSLASAFDMVNLWDPLFLDVLDEYLTAFAAVFDQPNSALKAVSIFGPAIQWSEPFLRFPGTGTNKDKLIAAGYTTEVDRELFRDVFRLHRDRFRFLDSVLEINPYQTITSNVAATEVAIGNAIIADAVDILGDRLVLGNDSVRHPGTTASALSAEYFQTTAGAEGTYHFLSSNTGTTGAPTGAQSWQGSSALLRNADGTTGLNRSGDVELMAYYAYDIGARAIELPPYADDDVTDEEAAGLYALYDTIGYPSTMPTFKRPQTQDSLAYLADLQRFDVIDSIADEVETLTAVPYERQFTRLTADWTGTDTVTLANVTGLALAVEASTTYRVEGIVFVDADPTDDFKLAITVPASSTGYQIIGLPGSGATTYVTGVSLAVEDWATEVIGGGVADDILLARIDGILVVDTTAGSIQLQAAKRAAGANANPVIKANSWISTTKVA